jgi:WD40 repeat protein
MHASPLCLDNQSASWTASLRKRLEEILRLFAAVFALVSVMTLVSPVSLGEQVEVVPLLSEEDGTGERVLEAFLAPAEFSNRRFVYVSKGQEAVFSLDSSLSATEPFAELHPERLEWPRVAGLELRAEGGSLKLKPAIQGVDDDTLDEGFSVRWTFAPLGQRFEPFPYFAVRVVEAEVVATRDGKRLFFWQAPPPLSVCDPRSKKETPNCTLKGVGREARSLALSPDGKLLALALGGLRPRLEVYNILDVPSLAWFSLLGTESGGAVEVAFSTDGKWVVALTGRGRMHRFEAMTGGRHLSIPSIGRTARAIPPGRIMAVAGEEGEVNLWYLGDGTIAWSLRPRDFRGPVDRLAASGDGKRFATLEYEKGNTVVRIWQIRRRAILAQIKAEPYAISDIALDEEGKTLYMAHETKGLLKVQVAKDGVPEVMGGEAGRRCRGRLQWISGLKSLGCTVPGGEVRIDRQGRKTGEINVGIKASDWIVAASESGGRMAAVGGGNLLIWWSD